MTTNPFHVLAPLRSTPVVPEAVPTVSVDRRALAGLRALSSAAADFKAGRIATERVASWLRPLLYAVGLRGDALEQELQDMLEIW